MHLIKKEKLDEIFLIWLKKPGILKTCDKLTSNNWQNDGNFYIKNCHKM